jgi:hypothetical protein
MLQQHCGPGGALADSHGVGQFPHELDSSPALSRRVRHWRPPRAVVNDLETQNVSLGPQTQLDHRVRPRLRWVGMFDSVGDRLGHRKD